MNRPLLVTMPLLLLLATAADAQTTQATPPGPPPGNTPIAVAPPAPPPTSAPTMPAAPPSPPPEQENASVAAPEASSQGQWTYTDQYGWIWAPYADSYVYVPKSGAVPQMYVYSPSVGWTWVVAPWVWGLGPRPYFVFGTSRYVWWGRGFGRWYGFAPRYVTWGPRGYWAGGRWTAPRVYHVAPHELARAPSHPAVREGHAGHHH